MTLNNQTGLRQLGRVAPTIRITVVIAGKKQVKVTQGFELGYLALIPSEGWAFTEWQLIHKPTGFCMATFSHQDLRLARMTLVAIAQWDWRGSDVKLVSKETRDKWTALYNELQLDKATSTLEQEAYEERKAERRRGSKRTKI